MYPRRTLSGLLKHMIDGGEIREKMDRYEKLDKVKVDDPTVAKKYMENKAVGDCRVIFRIWTNMLYLKDNKLMSKSHPD